MSKQLSRTTRELIVQVVLDLTSIVGFEELTVKQVCAAAGVAPRTLYNNFRDLDAAFAEGYRRIDAEFERVVLAAYHGHEDPEPCARACVAAALGFVLRDQMAAEAFFVHGFAAGEEVSEMRASRVAWMERLIAERLANDDLAQIPAAQQFAVEIAVGGVLSVVYRYASRGDLAGLAETEELLVETLLRPFSTDPDTAVAAALIAPPE